MQGGRPSIAAAPTQKKTQKVMKYFPLKRSQYCIYQENALEFKINGLERNTEHTRRLRCLQWIKKSV